MAEISTVENVSVEDLKRDLEIKELKIQNLSLQLKNEKLQRALTSTVPQDSLFVSIETRLTVGFERFIELNDTNTHIHQSYGSWYSDVLQRMEVSSCYVYKNHIFAKSFHNKSYVTGYFYSRNNDQKTGTHYIGMVQDVNNVLDK